ncbi:hypothetical protein EVAR_76951_1 [Eumeta japonica]|uniref:Uncharacterized protein n=1 Tax=Eumeta variegata TaxID=151549 RepID=A0A4C1SEX8_EUMVA|nr:hypothetical protein EVAR_76951_1 [Eumeta japonica]
MAVDRDLSSDHDGDFSPDTGSDCCEPIRELESVSTNQKDLDNNDMSVSEAQPNISNKKRALWKYRRMKKTKTQGKQRVMENKF